MGFEITFHYHDRKEDGKYNTDEKKSFSKNVGKKGEESSLDEAARVILAQLARRDIWVVDVGVHEFVRKQISFKETKGGIVIKNKKYSLDHGTLEGEELPETLEVSVPQVRTNPVVSPNVSVTPKPTITPTGLVLAPPPPQIFRPHRDTKPEEIKKYKLSVGKKYEILGEKLQNTSEGPTYVYLVINDEGQKSVVPSAHFDSIPVGLPSSAIGIPDTRLSYSNEIIEDMPSLRR